MIRAKIVLTGGEFSRVIDEVTLPERPLVGSMVSGSYKVLSIIEPVPIGKNLSAGEPTIGIEVRVKEI